MEVWRGAGTGLGRWLSLCLPLWFLQAPPGLSRHPLGAVPLKVTQSIWVHLSPVGSQAPWLSGWDAGPFHGSQPPSQTGDASQTPCSSGSREEDTSSQSGSLEASDTSNLPPNGSGKISLCPSRNFSVHLKLFQNLSTYIQYTYKYIF